MRQFIETCRVDHSNQMMSLASMVTPFFTRRIIDEPVTLWFKMLQFESYDGISDPIDLPENFKAIMLLHKATGKSFVGFSIHLVECSSLLVLKSRANLISYFKQLSQSFVVHFVSNHR